MTTSRPALSARTSSGRTRRVATLAGLGATLVLVACSNTTSTLKPLKTLPPIDTSSVSSPTVVPFDSLAPIDPNPPEWTVPNYTLPGPPIPKPPSKTTPKTTVKATPKTTVKAPTKTTVKAPTKTTVKAPPKTTAAPPESTGPTTPTTAAPLNKVVSANGIANIGFGSAPDPLIARLESTFGAPTEVADHAFPDPAPTGGYTDGTTNFAYPAMDKYCYANGFCVYFGGKTSDPAQHKFVGWEQTTPDGLTTKSGYTVGSTLADLASVTNVKLGPCPNRAIATSKPTVKVTFELLSNAGNFYETDPATPNSPAPDPAQVVATRMFAGAVPQPATPSC